MKLLADSLRHRLIDLDDRDLDRVGKGFLVGAAVALDDDAVETEQTGAVVLARVEGMAYPVEHVSRLRLKLDLSTWLTMAARPSAVFRETLPTKPSATTTSTLPV